MAATISESVGDGQAGLAHHNVSYSPDAYDDVQWGSFPAAATSPTSSAIPASLPTCPSASTIASQCVLVQDGTNLDILSSFQNQPPDGTTDRERPECGLGRWRPACLQRFASIKTFIFVCSLWALVSGTMVIGYVNSVITTIEKRYELGSSISGLFSSATEFGSLIAVIFVSYLGSSRNIPIWLGCGIIFQGIGGLLFTLPHFISEKYTISGGLNINSTEENICQSLGKNQEDILANQRCTDKSSTNWLSVLIFVLAQVLVGCGGTPLFTLGTIYVDDHVSKEKAPSYIAFMYATSALGPVVGFALGALMLQYYVDVFIFDHKELNLTPDDPRWIGTWWGGFIICGFVLCMMSVLFFMFPKTLKMEKARLEEDLKKTTDPKELVQDPDRVQEQNYGKNIKDIPRSMFKLLLNPIYVMCCLGICCEISIVSGFTVFLAKYLETQFGISKSIANLLTGGIAIPGAVIGILVGGFILRRLQLQAKGAIQMTLMMNLIALSGFSVLFFLGCDNVKMAGATLPYFNGTGHGIFHANLTASCNSKCNCSPNDLEPICGVNGMTYFSPCHAGCTHIYGASLPKSLNYSDCSCIHGDALKQEVLVSPLATSGPCTQTCHNLIPFLVMLVILTFVIASTNIPLLMVTMRFWYVVLALPGKSCCSCPCGSCSMTCQAVPEPKVKEEERAFALGMQFVILRLFAYIPAPIMFGNTIDTTCLLWKQQCGQQGSCLIYDIVNFRYKYLGIGTGLKLVGAFFFFVVWILISCKSRKRSYETTSGTCGTDGSQGESTTGGGGQSTDQNSSTDNQELGAPAALDEKKFTAESNDHWSPQGSEDTPNSNTQMDSKCTDSQNAEQDSAFGSLRVNTQCHGNFILGDPADADDNEPVATDASRVASTGWNVQIAEKRADIAQTSYL